MVMEMAPNEKISALLKVRREIGNCSTCQLCQGRSNIVFGEGNPFADLMFVGEGPGEREDTLARPFVGKSGELLDKGLAHNDLTRDDVYITNLVKCRPPGNRNPTITELGLCTPFLYEQIKVIAPKCIVTLGKVAAEYLLKRDVKITKERGMIFHCYDFPHIFLIPTLHPSYILRNGGKGKGRFYHDIEHGLEKAYSGLNPDQWEEALYQDWMKSNEKYWRNMKGCPHLY
jgi:DNA polymerase